MYRQILTTNGKKNVWELGKRIYTLNLRLKGFTELTRIHVIETQISWKKSAFSFVYHDRLKWALISNSTKTRKKFE